VSCAFAYDDGAYILGALSPAERADYERHLPTCAHCREAVATLAVLPGLLGRLDPSTAVPTVTAPLTLMPRLLAAAASRRRAERRRRSWFSVAVATAAAMVAVAVGVGVHLADRTPTAPVVAPTATPIPMSAMRQTPRMLPIEAEIGLSRAEAGTWVAMRCRYEEGYSNSWPVRLVVFPKFGGPTEQVGTWMATSGREVRLTTLTHFAPDEIGRVELQGEDATTLLWWTPQ